MSTRVLVLALAMLLPFSASWALTEEEAQEALQTGDTDATLTNEDGETVYANDLQGLDGSYTSAYECKCEELPAPDPVNENAGAIEFDQNTEGVEDLQRLQALVRGYPELAHLGDKMGSLAVVLDKHQDTVENTGSDGMYASIDAGGTFETDEDVITAGGTFDTGCNSTSPIVLDLNGNGKPDLYDTNWRSDRKFRPKGAVVFDIDGDGKVELVEWMHPNKDGLLCVDKNSDAWISGQKELFGNEGKYQNGYQKLAATLDTNRDGVVTGKELAPLKIWIDNGDAKSTPEELHTPAELGITHIGVKDDDLVSFFTQNGQDRKTWDWFTEYLE